jgi:MYXO-CTERM domain-containing protein
LLVLHPPVSDGGVGMMMVGEEGCGCATSSAGSQGGGAIALVIFAIALAQRRRV